MERIKVIISLVMIMAIVHIANIVAGGKLMVFGISPGVTESLPFIYSAPWIHGSWEHLTNNLIGLSIFSALSLIRGKDFFIRASFIIITLTGLLVWFFGRSHSVHVGASGWIFGLWSLSITLAWFQRSFTNILIAFFVAVFYGGMIWGVLPSSPHISFESHLFGAVSGVVAAYTLTKFLKAPTRRKRR